MEQFQVQLLAPLTGVYIDLASVPDPVFAEKIVGDGFAIDPLEPQLVAPIAGQIKSIHRAKHAITLATEYGFDILLHVGLDTVTLGGADFKIQVNEGDWVEAGALLAEFNLAELSEKARALITPVLVTDLEQQQLSLEHLPHSLVVNRLQPLLNIKFSINTTPYLVSSTLAAQVSMESPVIIIPNHHGIHARPAAQLSLIARKYAHQQILIVKGEQSANVKSVVSLLSLGVQYQDQVRLRVQGDNAANIIAELTAAILAFPEDSQELSAPEEPSAPEKLSASEVESSLDKLPVEESTPTAIHLRQVSNGKYQGIAAAAGLAVALGVHYTDLKFDYPLTTNDSLVDQEQLKKSIATLVDELEQEIKQFSIAEEHRNILTAHLQILTDPELMANANQLIASGKSAAAAWAQVSEESCQALAATNNRLLSERQSDIRDVLTRVLAKLCNQSLQVSPVFEHEVILIAADFTPSQVMNLPSQVRGLVSVYGGVTSHAAILARSRAIPYLIGVAQEVLRQPEQIMVLDTITNAELISMPTAAEIELIQARLSKQSQAQVLLQQSALEPALTKDGVRINCLANISNLTEAQDAAVNGAEGVGLFRTEFMFLGGNQAPNEEQQLAQYQQINQALNGKILTIRTLDVGGDKILPYLTQPHEDNPMLGVRGVRLCLAERELFKTQIRAILRTQADNIQVMIPMVATLSEYRMVKQLFAQVKAELGVSTQFKLGIMVEVPAVVLQSKLFANEVDFMSIGSNDLTQYMLAIDREHTQLASQADHLHPAVLNAIALIVSGAEAAKIEVSLCGLMASEKLAIPVLIGLGITTLSMSIAAIPENKAWIRSLNLNHCQQVATHCLSLTSANEVREYLTTQFN